VLKARDVASAPVVLDSGIPIDLIFTDVMMPGPLRSPELARKQGPVAQRRGAFHVGLHAERHRARRPP
jgi:hypothetical protein